MPPHKRLAVSFIPGHSSICSVSEDTPRKAVVHRGLSSVSPVFIWGTQFCEPGSQNLSGHLILQGLETSMLRESKESIYRYHSAD